MECRQKDEECCDGQCINTSTYQSDPNHCGKCIVQCEKDERCVKGQCVGSNRLSIRFEYVGFKFVESTSEDCPDLRPGGREVLTARLSLIRSGLYEGPGRFSADIDACGLTPNREDPGMVQDRDNFLGCKVTTIVPEYPVHVRVEVDMVDANRPNYVKIEWEPTKAPDVQVSTGCEPAYQAGYVTQMTRDYRRVNRREITDYDLLPQLAPGGRLRNGRYTDPEGTDEGRWIFTVGD
jgi:hypothetical protein